MPFCGYHPKMVQGLAIFSDGLFEATKERAVANQIPLQDAFAKELAEIRALSVAMGDAPDRRRLIKGLALFAETLLDTALDRSQKESRSFEDCFRDEVAVISTLVKDVENQYQSYRSRQSVPDAMCELADYLAAY